MQVKFGPLCAPIVELLKDVACNVKGMVHPKI